jgi:hypothetical protein
MVKKNQNIEIVSQEDFKGHNSFHLVNCIVGTIDLIGVFKLDVHLVLENCIINDMKIHSCWPSNGLLIKNCIVKNYIDYQMGGHNKKPIVIEESIFLGFFNFFDCQFENRIELKNNIFTKGANLLGNKGEGFENSFVEGWHAENNIGDIGVNQVVV